MLSVEDGDENTTTFTYYPNGQLGAGRVASTTDALGQVSYRSYNLLGNVVREWGETTYPVEYSFNEFGERVGMTTFRTGDDEDFWVESSWPATPPAGDETEWVYDEATGLLTAKTDAAEESVTYAYTTAGRLAERNWARLDSQDDPLLTSYSYDSLTGERTLVDYADSTTDISYTYDRIGRLSTVVDAAGSRSFTYNAGLQLESETIASYYGTDKLLTPTYETGVPGTNMVGRYQGFELGVAADTDADYAVDYGFDAHGRLNAVIDANSTYGYTYVTDSNLLSSVSSPVHTTTYSYEANRDLKLTVQNGTYSTYAYRYDEIGRRTDRVQSGSVFAQSSFDAFDYNTRSEVIRSDRYEGTDPADTSSPVTGDVFGYEFDPIGNRISSSKAGVSETYVANVLNQYTDVGTDAYSHDADGNLMSDGDRSLAWTAENRLKTVEPVSPTIGDEKLDFVYDYLGRRIRKTVSEWNGSTYTTVSDEKFIYDGWNLVAVYDATNSNTLLKTLTSGLDLSRSLQGAGGVGGLLGVEEVSGAYHFAYDANGNVTEVIDDAGTLAAHYEYDPFGNTIRSSGTYAGINTFRFSTKYWDEETEFYYYGYRYYDPATGRWLNRDPIGERGGVNLYAVLFNSTLNSADYLGMIVCVKTDGETSIDFTFELDESTQVELETSGTIEVTNGEITYTLTLELDGSVTVMDETGSVSSYTANATVTQTVSTTEGEVTVSAGNTTTYNIVTGETSSTNSVEVSYQNSNEGGLVDSAYVKPSVEVNDSGMSPGLGAGVGGNLSENTTWKASATTDFGGNYTIGGEISFSF